MVIKLHTYSLYTYLGAVEPVELQHEERDRLPNGLDHHQEADQGHPHTPAQLRKAGKSNSQSISQPVSPSVKAAATDDGKAGERPDRSVSLDHVTCVSLGVITCWREFEKKKKKTWFVPCFYTEYTPLGIYY